MALSLFEREVEPREDPDRVASDAVSRTLSVAAVENAFVERVYGKLASIYDFVFGPTLHTGRVQAIQRMGIRKGDRILEVGVGTGINAGLYPRDCAVIGIDLSASMLEKGRDRIARKGITNVRLLQMDAADLEFPDDSFDIVYAPYLISVVPDPVKVACEMHRVCRQGGRIIFLNHFMSPNRILSRIERVISPFTVHIGFKADLDLPAFLAQASLQPISIEKVNLPRLWSLVTCVKDGHARTNGNGQAS
jgi:phosphatidylethanolamine/phosphatidyl-N-methylethanolamine N-methyltransferase